MPRTIHHYKLTIAKTKRQHFERMWIPYSKRMPPKTEEKFLCWNYKIKAGVVVSGILINAQQEQLRNGWIKRENINCEFSGYFTNRWMRIFPPC